MPRYQAIIAYDGTNYSGFQSQDNGNTVQAELEKTISKLNGNQRTIIYGSGRTDAGVHAWGQVIHFDLEHGRDVEKIRHAFDTQTPADISVRSVAEVHPEFHARYHAVEKTYHYHLDIGKPKNVFKRHFAAYQPYPLDVSKMEAALTALIGTHDFTSFCATGTMIENKVRTIHEATISYLGPDELLFTFRGDGFLYKMVRILVGTLIKIGRGQIEPEAMAQMIAAEDREAAGPTAHPQGLYLMEVKYE